ncbi:MAG: hypothetical protein KTR31_40775 [Myxococcales bacterium]|nr:hypothetical protein [Myxococcales bacterium]
MWTSLLALGACGLLQTLDPPVPAPPSALPLLEVEGPVWTAVVTVAHRPLPPRFDADMPDTVAAWRQTPGAFPPVGQMREAVCAGAGDAREQLLDRMARAPHPEWADLLDGCGSAEACRWLAERLPQLPLAAAGAAYDGLLGCEDPAALERLAGSDVPAPVLLHAAYSHRTVPVRRLEAAVRSLAEQEQHALVQVGLDVLAEDPSDEAEAALIRLHGELGDLYQRRVGQALWGRSSPRARRLHQRACEGAREPRCGAGSEQRGAASLDPFEALVDPTRDVDSVVARLAGAPELEEALASCVFQSMGVQDGRARTCLGQLLEHGFEERARGIAGMHDSFHDLNVAVTVGADALVQRVVAAGFEVSAPGAAGVHTASDLLEASGDAASFRIDDDRADPVQILSRLSRLAGLDDVRFSSVAPVGGVAGPEQRRPTLYAWTGGARLRTLMDPQGPWRGLEYHVGLVNAVLRHREAEVRLGVAAAGERSRMVVAGAPSALEALGADQLVVWEQPPLGALDAVALDTGL